MLKKEKIFLATFFLVLSIIFTPAIIYKNKNIIKEYFWVYLPERLQIISKLVVNKKLTNNFKNDYNTKFLPDTQFQEVLLEKIDLSFLKSKNFSTNNYFNTSGLKSFFIEDMDDKKIWIINDNAQIYELDKTNFQKGKKINNVKKIKSNLNVSKVLDTLVVENKIFISLKEKNSGCEKFKIIFARINDDKLNFKNFFYDDECGKNIQAGRMQKYVHNKNRGILFTTGDNDSDNPNLKPQQRDSIYGKIIFQDFNSKQYEIFSVGHRNGQGLYVNDKLILMTEHGPRGGDEINKIIFKKNYGWPIASYGEKYSSNNLVYYKKSHENYGFEEPIYAFVPSIGICELIRLPNSFSKKWNNNFLITSLYGKSLFRVKFDKNFNKIIFIEKIYVGERIRDIKYSELNNMILLAFEEKGQLGILTLSK